MLNELRKLIRTTINNMVNETQVYRSVVRYADYFTKNFIPLSLPNVDWSHFHLKPSEFALQAKDFMKDVFNKIINRAQDNTTEIGNFYVYPTSSIMIKTDVDRITFNFDIEGYTNMYFPLQQGLHYNAFVFFVYQDVMREIFPINTFLHNNTKTLNAAAERYIRLNKINFQQAGSNNTIQIESILNIPLTFNLANYVSKYSQMTEPRKTELKNKYIKGAPIKTPYGVGRILSAKKQRQTGNYVLTVDLNPIFKTPKTFVLKTKDAVGIDSAAAE